MSQTGRKRTVRWEQVQETAEGQILTKLKVLSDESKAQVMRLIDDLLAHEHSRRMIREAFEMSERSLARSWDSRLDSPQFMNP